MPYTMLHIPRMHLSLLVTPCTSLLATPCAGPQVKKALWAGGIQRSNKPEGKRATPGLQVRGALAGLQQLRA